MYRLRDRTGTSRGRAAIYLLLVVAGGAILFADTVFDFTVSTSDYEIPFGIAGFTLLVGGIRSFIEAADRRRTRVIGWVGVAVGLALILVIDGFVALGPVVYYGGIGVLVVTGIVLFSMILDTTHQRSANAS